MDLVAQIDQINHPVNQIADFVKDYFSDLQHDEIYDIISKHLDYGTIDAIIQDGRVVACVRWNMDSTGKIFDVLDISISVNSNGFRIMKHLVARNWSRFPRAKFIRFFRYRKYPGRRARMYSIRQFLHIGGN